jgi:hypothetical protein
MPQDWGEILAKAGIPEPPGREEAIAAAEEVTRLRYLATGGEPPRKKGSNSSKAAKVSRAALRAKG